MARRRARVPSLANSPPVFSWLINGFFLLVVVAFVRAKVCGEDTKYDAPYVPTPAVAQPLAASPADSAGTVPAEAPPSAGSPAAAAPTALAQLAELRVAGRGPKTGYSREEFGPRWRDIDRNGCDQRNDILRRDLTDLTFKAGTRDCVVLTGTLLDPYTGSTIRFERGGASEVDIDHVVALSNAWQMGAARWDGDTRGRFANDPLNLAASDASANRQKGDGDAATWLPRNKSFRCAYVARQIAVKARYGLAVTKAEKDAMERVLGRCPSQPVADAGSPTPPGAYLDRAENARRARAPAPITVEETRRSRTRAARAGGAAPSCKKGCPCGNACISCSKTCRK